MIVPTSVYREVLRQVHENTAEADLPLPEVRCSVVDKGSFF